MHVPRCRSIYGFSAMAILTFTTSSTTMINRSHAHTGHMLGSGTYVVCPTADAARLARPPSECVLYTLGRTPIEEFLGLIKTSQDVRCIIRIRVPAVDSLEKSVVLDYFIARPAMSRTAQNICGTNI